MIVLFMGGNRNGNVSSAGLGTAGLFRGLNVSARTESLVLVARAGFFIPNGNNNRSRHHDAALQALRKAGAGAAVMMLERCGH
jgi:hypothetical protein